MLITDAIKFRAYLVSVAENMVGDHAEDVVQDLMEYLIKTRMNTAPTPERLLTWYVKNRCIQHLRKEKTKRKNEEGHKVAELESFDVYADRFEPEESDEDAINSLYLGMEKIDPFAKQLFLLVCVEGHHMTDISRGTDIPLSRLRYIYQLTKKYLRNETRR